MDVWRYEDSELIQTGAAHRQEMGGLQIGTISDSGTIWLKATLASLSWAYVGGENRISAYSN